MTPPIKAFHFESPPVHAAEHIDVKRSIGVRPFYLDFLANAVNHLLIVRSNGAYTLHNAVSAASNNDSSTNKNSSHAPRQLDVAKTAILPGNLAKIALTCHDKTWGVDWIAPSFKAKRAVLNASTSTRSQVVLTSKDGAINVSGTEFVDRSREGGDKWTPIEWTHQFQPTLQATCDERQHDSEHLLLNFLADLIASGTIQQQKEKPGFLSIVSERIPCDSCTRNIREFLKSNQWINLRLFYFHDTHDRGVKDFLAECGQEQILTLTKIALESVVHLIDAEADAKVVLSEHVQEQQKMFGGAPNQIVTMVNPSSPK